MKEIAEYLDNAKAITGSDYKTAQALGITRQHLSAFRRGKAISDDMCYKLAELLKISPIEIIGERNAAKATDAKMRKKWEELARSVAAVILMAIGITSPTEDAAAADLERPTVDHVRDYAQWLQWLAELLGLPTPSLKLA
jgi:transcriptional regulator with XRE-family HTH domain